MVGAVIGFGRFKSTFPRCRQGLARRVGDWSRAMKKTEPFDVADEEVWPAVPLEAWHDTCTTLHLWTQIVGKIRMARTPLVNHWWNTTLYVTCRGLSNSSIPYRGRNFHIDFDFMAHELRIGTTTGDGRSFPLEPMAVADFYAKTMQALRELDIEVAIYPVPVELEEAIPFARDRQHASYDRDHVHRYWRALVQVDNVFSEFRSRYLGKVSPVHFFWGAFDLAVTRFSGRSAPR